ncbi:MAG: Fe-S cluster domain-containing protein [Phocaeicola sp.]
MDVILVAVISLGAIGLVAAVILFVASKKFAVYEDPRIAQVNEALPQANCGGCGFPGCGGFANGCVKAADAGSLEGLSCPVGGSAVMEAVAAVLGMEAVVSEPKVAVVRCNGSCENRPRTSQYDGVSSCAIAHATYGGETACSNGCLGCGDCVSVCAFDAIQMNSETGLPEVDEVKCTACGACVKACPRAIIEIRPKGKNNRRVYVSCVNKEKGALANKACKVSCIACSKCVKVCPFDSITIENNLAYIDPIKCKLCRKCESECPKNAILAVNFPPRKPKVEKPVDVAPKEQIAIDKKNAEESVAPNVEAPTQ